MKRLIIALFAISLLCSSVFAFDYVGVNAGSKNGKFSKTANPVFQTVTATTENFDVVTINNATCAVVTATTGNFTNLGGALNTRAYAITGGSALTAGVVTLTGLIANVTTAAVTVSTGNVNIPVTVNGTLLYIKANTAL